LTVTDLGALFTISPQKGARGLFGSWEVWLGENEAHTPVDR
jgi:hypothetical protein